MPRLLSNSGLNKTPSATVRQRNAGEKGEHTYTSLFQPPQSISARSCTLHRVYIELAIGIDAANRSPELDADDYEADGPEHKEHEGAHYDYAGKQLSLRYEPQHDADVGYRESANSHPVWEIPRDTRQLCMSITRIEREEGVTYHGIITFNCV